MAYLSKIVHTTSRGLNAVGSVLLVCMMGIVFVNVVSRSLGQPIFGVYEFVGFFLALQVSFSIAECAVKKGHIAVSIVADRLPTAVLPFLDALVALLGTALYLVLSWQCCVYAKRVWRIGEVSLSTEIPFYPFILGLAFGFLLLALVLVVDFFEALKRIAGK